MGGIEQRVLPRLGFIFGMGFGLAAFIGKAANFVDTQWAIYLVLFGIWNLLLDLISLEGRRPI